MRQTNTNNTWCWMCLLIVAGFGMAVPAADEDRFAKVEIKTEKVADGIYVLFGSGGNIGVSVGEDGVFLIDDQYAPLTEKILAAIRKLSDKPVRFVLNTHWHGDHTGGNDNLGKTGTVVVAHDKVRERMTHENFLKAFNMKVPPSPKGALPVITFNDALTFHLNGQTMRAVYHKDAHTDGDSVIHFQEANVLHMGDTWFNGMYPFIDVSSHGSIDGMIAAVEATLPLADVKTKIIPGHGPVSDKRGLQSYLEMLKTVRQRVKALIDAGKSLEEIQNARPNAEDYDKTLSGGFIKPEAFLELVYKSLL